MKHRLTALALLVVGMVAAYAWQFGPADIEIKGQVWNISGAVYRLLLLALLAAIYRTWEMYAVCALLGVFDAMVAGCSGLYLYAPWPTLPGDEACSSKFNAPLGMIGAAMGLLLVIAIVKGKS